jgi:hypothetical protein
VEERNALETNMGGHFGFLETNFQNLISKINHETTVLSGTVAVSVLIF